MLAHNLKLLPNWPKQWNAFTRQSRGNHMVIVVATRKMPSNVPVLRWLAGSSTRSASLTWQADLPVNPVK